MSSISEVLLTIVVIKVHLTLQVVLSHCRTLAFVHSLGLAGGQVVTPSGQVTEVPPVGAVEAAVAVCA